jgi:heme a synthase
VGQAAIGYWQYLTGVPALLVAFHVLGAALVWVAVLRVWLSLSVPAPVDVPPPAVPEYASSIAGSPRENG